MSKYTGLWEYVHKRGQNSIQLTFDEIKEMIGFNIDHSFLTYKKELVDYGYQVGKISMKEKSIVFNKIKENVK